MPPLVVFHEFYSIFHPIISILVKTIVIGQFNLKLFYFNSI